MAIGKTSNGPPTQLIYVAPPLAVANGLIFEYFTALILVNDGGINVANCLHIKGIKDIAGVFLVNSTISAPYTNS